VRQNVLWHSWAWRVENKRHEIVLSCHHFSKMEPETVTGWSPLLCWQHLLAVHKVTTGNTVDGPNLLPEPKMDMNSPTLRCLKGYDPRPFSGQSRVVCHIRIPLFLLRLLCPF